MCICIFLSISQANHVHPPAKETDYIKKLPSLLRFILIYMTVPFNRFVTHLLSHFFFLVLITLNVTNPKAGIYIFFRSHIFSPPPSMENNSSPRFSFIFLGGY